MQFNKRFTRKRSLSPTVLSLEGRTLLSTMMPNHMEKSHQSAHVLDVMHHGVEQAKKHVPSVTVESKVEFGGYQFVNFDGPNHGTNSAAGHQHERNLEQRQFGRL